MALFHSKTRRRMINLFIMVESVPQIFNLNCCFYFAEVEIQRVFLSPETCKAAITIVDVSFCFPIVFIFDHKYIVSMLFAP